MPTLFSVSLILFWLFALLHEGQHCGVSTQKLESLLLFQNPCMKLECSDSDGHSKAMIYALLNWNGLIAPVIGLVFSPLAP